MIGKTAYFQQSKKFLQVPSKMPRKNNSSLSKMTSSTPDVWIKIRYSIAGPTQSIKLKDFEKIESDFLAGRSKFDDGFYGYYHKDALCDTPIRLTNDYGVEFEMMRRSSDGKYLVCVVEFPFQDKKVKK